MQNANRRRRRRRRREYTVCTHDNTPKKNTYTHSVYSRKRVWKNHRLTAVKMKLRHGEIEGAPSSLFPAAFHYLKHQPSHTHDTPHTSAPPPLS